ncbi:TolC family outer membrane protein [Hyphomicrobium sp.]|uniref:TolC family outer membrane protein n=1 Tax=Hyphomicrobium sp. TaxID=82 RepID=UPI003D1148AE
MLDFRRTLRIAASAVLATAGLLVVCGPSPASAETLNQALAATYEYNPQLDAERARLRATDEEVTRARSGFRPVITGGADYTYNWTKQTASVGSQETEVKPGGYSVDITQPIFSGFRVINAVNEAEAGVRAGRETLRSVEQGVLLEAVTSFMDVVRDQAIVRLRENNVNVLSRELKATEDRFAVGEVTRTDVAQAQARRAGAVSALDLAKANLKTSRATYERVVGHAPGNLVEPAGYERYLPRTLDEAKNIGTNENPAVVNALYTEQGAKYAVDRIRGELLPSVSLEASYSDRFETSDDINESENVSVSGRLTVPIYEGGEVYARVRQQKHIHISTLQQIELARSQTEENVVASWSQLLASRAQILSDQSQVDANTTALTGVREEERVGQRTLLDVLNAEVELLNSQVALVSTRRNLVVSSYAVLSSIGRLDAVNLGFTSVAYDPEAHYQEVRRKPWGTSITHSDGRIEELPSPPDGYEPAK